MDNKQTQNIKEYLRIKDSQDISCNIEQKKVKNEIQKNEIHSWLKYFQNNNLNENDEEVIKKIQDSITKIFKAEIEELGYKFEPNDQEKSDIILNMINDASKPKSGSHEYRKRVKFNGDVEKDKSRITYNIHPISARLKSQNIETRLTACKEMFKDVFHEIEHECQWRMIDLGISNKEALMYARDYALQNWLNKDFCSFDIETGNYERLAVESDANEIGYKKYLNLIGENDKKTESLRDAETVKKGLGMYKINTTSFDGGSRYNSHGLKERDDISDEILDDLICNRKFTDILKMCPILTKEYNIDGTKRNSLELINNMNSEIKQISENSVINDKEKIEITQDIKEMYYELIYRMLEKEEPNQLMQTKNKIGNEKSKRIFEDMSKYFQKEKDSKIKISEKMKESSIFVPHSNNGSIQVEKNGSKVRVSFYEFMRMINPEVMKKRFTLPNGRNSISSEEFLRKFGFQYLPQDGEMVLKNGTKISALQYAEEYMLQKMDSQLKKDYQMINFLEDTIQSANAVKEQEETKARIDNYYENKKQVINNIIDRVTDEPGKINSKEENINIKPHNIAKDTVKSNITKQEIKEVMNDIQKTKNQQNNEKEK